MGGIWRQNKQTGQWQKYNEQTGQWEDTDPPWWAEQVGLFPIGRQRLQGFGDPDLGITPDVNGNVSPRVWIETYSAQSLTELTADDVLDFFMVMDEGWGIATDFDEQLKQDIGAENIIRHRLVAGPGTPPTAVLLELNDISVRNLARFMNDTGFPTIISENAYGTWRLHYDESMNVVRIRWKGQLVHEIPLD